jgi:glycosyltransferase involved in cell wall biosynthesis
MGWAVALDDVVEPADVWHGMWAGSLPALARMRRRHGGRTIYDSRDVFMHSRQYARLGRPGRNLLEWAERRWARGADRVLTVNDAYAELLEKQLRVSRPIVVMNCREIWTPPSPRPDLIREALSLPAETAVVLYQGILTMERGIEESMDAILEVLSAVLVLMGFGMLEESLTEQVSRPPYLGRVLLLPPVPPEDLLVWSASADVLVMAIQPTTLNHRYTTPQKLFESMAAGVPVVASDLPGMAPIVRATASGVLCDPTSPASISEAISSIVTAPCEERQAMRERSLRAAHDRYNWEAQLDTLFGVYRELLPAAVRDVRGGPATAGTG